MPLERLHPMKKGELGDTPKPLAGRPLHPLVEGKGIIGGHPQTPGRETPAPPLLGKGKGWGTPPSPRQGDPCTPYWGSKDRIGGYPQTPGRELPAPLCVGEGVMG